MSYSKYIPNDTTDKPISSNYRSYTPDESHIVYASDDRFAEILGVSLVSLFENSMDMGIVLYILDSGITSGNKEKLEAVCKSYKRKPPVWIEAKDISKELSMEVAVDRGSLTQYARLFLSGCLPEHLGRVLYLDCDILINHSIRELWNLDLHGKTIAALMDAFSKAYRKNIDLEPDDIMFNSGVMLIDLDKWRRDNVEKKLLSFIIRKKGHIQQGDQGALNAVLSKETYCFKPQMNAVTIYFDFTYDELLAYRKPQGVYTREQIKEAVKDPYIIHFTTSFASRRPWVKGCKHRYVSDWLKYKGMSPWKDEPLWEHKEQNAIKGIYKKVVAILPRRVMIALSGLLQAYGRPLMNRLRI